MLLFRTIKTGVWLAGLVVTLYMPVPVLGGGFIASLSSDEMTAAGINALSADEVSALDRLVAEDIDRVQLLNSVSLSSSFTDRQTQARLKEAGLDRLTPEQLTKINDLVASSLVVQPQPHPRERPRLKDNEVVRLERRLQVHGGMSFTYGWAGGGRNYRETGAWISYFDPVTGLGIGFGYSRLKGDGFYGYHPDYYGAGGYYYGAPVTAAPRTYFMAADPVSVGTARGGFKGDGASLRGPLVKGGPGEDILR